MKFYRFCYWTALVCTLLYGLYSGNRFCWTLFLLLLLALAAALAVNLWTVFSFSYIQELSASQGEKGEAVGLKIGIYNDKPFPFTHMRVHVEAPAAEESQVLEINLAPKADCSFDLRLALPLRGEFLVGMTVLELQDVFGLLPMRFDLRRLPYYRQRPLLVLPRVRELALPAGKMDRALGSGLAAPGAGLDEFAYPREWRTEDHLSHVHWAATAKTRKLHARQYEEPAGGRCLIYLDCRALSDPLSDRLAECAATLLHAHLRRGDSVQLMSSRAEDPQPKNAFGISELTGLRQWLAVLKFDQIISGAEGFEQAVAVGGYSRVYALGGAFDPAIARALEASGLQSFYWLAEPLQASGMSGAQLRTAWLGTGDLPEFLYRNLVEGT